jgi:hypothetical protein
LRLWDVGTGDLLATSEEFDTKSLTPSPGM